MDKKIISFGLKSIIWACLGVVFFSVLFVFSNLFFPFITSKTFAFQIAVEVMFVAFLLLCLVDEKYRLHTNLTVWLILAYLVILTIASAFSGNDFYHSFWSNNEREDGILLLIHLFLFSWVLTSFFRSLKEWLYVFDLFLVASFCVAIVSLDQYLALEFPSFWTDHFIPSSNGARLAATIGNAGYVGGYMVFGIFMSLFMLLKRNNLWLKLWYGFLFLLELFIAIQTQTRGAYLALAFGLTVSAIYLMWFYYKNNYLKAILVVSLAVSIIGIGGIFIFNDSDFVKNQPIFNRIASISISEGNNRLVTWKMGFEGFQKKPILGYGQENFYQVFDRYYSTKNTEQWFDRCHNMICDRAITGGIFGLLLYLGLLLLPFCFIWFYYIKEYKDVNSTEESSRKYLVPVIFSILIVAYIVQNMFIFEALVTYIPLIMVLSFVGLYSGRLDFDWWGNMNLKTVSVVGSLVLIGPSLWIFIISPYSANRDFIKVIASESYSLDKKISAFEEVIDRGTYGNQEYRRHYFSFFEGVISEYLSNINNRNEDNNRLLVDFSKKMETQLDNQITENPYSVSNYLLLLRFYNLAYYFDVSRLQKAINVSEKAIFLSPGRPQIYYEIATSHYYIGNYLFSLNKESEAVGEFRSALDWFYDGASKNINKYQSLDQLLSFLNAISSNTGNETIAKALAAGGGRYKVTEVTQEMINWFNDTRDQQSEDDHENIKKDIKNIIQWLIKADPKNLELQSQLNKLQ